MKLAETESLQPMLPMCYKRIMREWVREQLMRRRKKPVTNNSESTGKIGHEIPQNQPSPLQPSYPSYLQRAEPERAKPERAETGQEQVRAAPPENASVRSDHAEAEGLAETPPRSDGPPRQNGHIGSRNRGRNDGRNRGRRPERDADRNPRPSQMSGQPPSQASAGLTSQVTSRDDDATETGGGDEPVLVHETQPESLATPPAALQVAPSKGYVVLTIGLPGSGKTTWFKRRGVTPLSSDMLRSILFDDITEQRYQGLVFSTLRSLLRARLIAKMPWNYVDATNLSPHERRQWIKMARSFGYEVQAVFFDVPFEICMQRNLRRDRMLNEETMAKMQERLRPPSFQEGFHKITVVRVKNSPTETPAEAFDPPVS